MKNARKFLKRKFFQFFLGKNWLLSKFDYIIRLIFFIKIICTLLFIVTIEVDVYNLSDEQADNFFKWHKLFLKKWHFNIFNIIFF